MERSSPESAADQEELAHSPLTLCVFHFDCLNSEKERKLERSTGSRWIPMVVWEAHTGECWDVADCLPDNCSVSDSRYFSLLSLPLSLPLPLSSDSNFDL